MCIGCVVVFLLEFVLWMLFTIFIWLNKLACMADVIITSFSISFSTDVRFFTCQKNWISRFFHIHHLVSGKEHLNLHIGAEEYVVCLCEMTHNQSIHSCSTFCIAIGGADVKESKSNTQVTIFSVKSKIKIVCLRVMGHTFVRFDSTRMKPHTYSEPPIHNDVSVNSWAINKNKHRKKPINVSI